MTMNSKDKDRIEVNNGMKQHDKFRLQFVLLFKDNFILMSMVTICYIYIYKLVSSDSYSTILYLCFLLNLRLLFQQ